jgi:NitT/TauT family transport system permease protein
MIVMIVIGLLADRIIFGPWERFLHQSWGANSGG